MTWPVTPATKANLDAATDDPSQARAELVALIDSFNNLVSLLSKSGGNDKVLVTNASGNLGLSVNPSAWSIGKAIELGYSGNALLSTSAAEVFMTQGMYYDNTWKYGVTGSACALYKQGAGEHVWRTAPSGTTGNTATPTDLMILKATGNLLVPGIYSTTTTSKPNVFVDTDGTLKRSTAAFRGALATAGGQTVTTMATVDLTTTVYDTDSIVNLTNNTFTVPAGVTKVRLSGSCQFNTNTTYTHAAYFGKGASFTPSVGARQSFGIGGGVDMHTGIISVSAGDYFTPRCNSSTSDILNSDSWFQMEIIE